MCHIYNLDYLYLLATMSSEDKSNKKPRGFDVLFAKMPDNDVNIKLEIEETCLHFTLRPVVIEIKNCRKLEMH